MVEEVSVLVADRRRKEPRVIPRPEHMRPKKGGVDAAKKAVSVLARTQVRRQVTSG